MGTKLRRISYSPITRLVAFFIVVACFSYAAITFSGLAKNTSGLESLSRSNFVNSNELFNYEQNFYIGLNSLLTLKNEDYIKQGNTIDKTEFESRKQELFSEWYNQKNGVPGGYNMDSYNLLKDKFETENTDRIAEIYNSMINEQIRSYYSLLQRVNKKDGLYFYATDGVNIYSNCNQAEPQFFSKFRAYYLSDKNGTEYYPNQDSKSYAYSYQTPTSSIDNKIYIAVTDEYISKMQIEWDKQHSYLQDGITKILSSVFLMLLTLLYIIWRTGRTSDDENIHLLPVDKLFTDLNVFIFISIVLIWIAGSIGIIRENYLSQGFENLQPAYWLVLLYNTIFCCIGFILFLSLIRHAKNKTLFTHSIIHILFTKIYSAAKAIFNMGPLSMRVAGVILISEFIAFIFTLLMIAAHSVLALFWLFMLIVLSVGWIYYIVLKLKSFSEIVEGVRKIKNGSLDHTINVQGEGDLARLARDINDIADGLKNAVEKETKAERMKAELITNVSHDLKTPLTSIINYIDLLSKEKLIPETANEYVAVVKQKSEKLKTLTQDLFEISKAQTGNVSVDLEKIDISVLLRQSLAEFDEQINKSGLDFKLNIQDEKPYIMADGKRLSRVFENLIGNILKYSLPQTRVYLDIFTDENNVFIEFKNVANYEMNFKEDEILERFVRGDKSRSTEGNGLGLAIAESYVAACGGRLKISVDGDLFKSIIRFNKA